MHNILMALHAGSQVSDRCLLGYLIYYTTTNGQLLAGVIICIKNCYMYTSFAQGPCCSVSLEMT